MIAVKDISKETTTLVGGRWVENEGGGAEINMYYKKWGLTLFRPRFFLTSGTGGGGSFGSSPHVTSKPLTLWSPN